MRILLTKISDERHALEIVRDDYGRERIELATREFLFHDLLHFTVESSIGTQEGFWGALASGKTMADINDRCGASMKTYAEAMAAIASESASHEALRDPASASDNRKT